MTTKKRLEQDSLNPRTYWGEGGGVGRRSKNVPADLECFFFFFTKYDGSEIFKKGFRLSNPKVVKKLALLKKSPARKKIYIHRLLDGFVNNIASLYIYIYIYIYLRIAY